MRVRCYLVQGFELHEHQWFPQSEVNACAVLDVWEAQQAARGVLQGPKPRGKPATKEPKKEPMPARKRARKGR